ncbi:reverse gyrase [Thermosphaera chiliense]|uniref:Reverse gyrase n=1 Tax=Thermosphaera chiliense TaxID=3402707 RepID=A0A7M1UUE1_9CREN|nr:reverse gyrase [Thermosphaera aggregans]QOR95022.1 reverse gyrase [Thermosphaera aggregans]
MSNLLNPYGFYRHACPNCGGEISDHRLFYKAPCEKCLSEDAFKKVLKRIREGALRDYRSVLEAYYEGLKDPRGLKQLLDEELALGDFEEFFEKATKGNKLWSAQKTWARRVLKNKSFSIIAPTGTGKTVFSLIISLYTASKTSSNGGVRRVYLVFPTLPLLLQAESKIKQFAVNAGLKICEEAEDKSCLKILAVHGKSDKKSKEELMERVRNGDFDILLSTSAFFHKNFELLKNKDFALIIMDDVDAVLKSGKAVKKLLNLVNVTDDAINDGLNLIKLRQRIVFSTGEEKEKLSAEIEELEKRVARVKSGIKTTLVVNSATGRPRGIYPKLFKVFLDFEAGSKPEAIRNIVDAYVEADDPENALLEIASKLKDGFLVFVPVDKGVEYADRVAELLRTRGLKSESFHAKKKVDVLNDFARGELNCLVGVATYYGVMVRGIDLPERVKYVVFLGVPRHKFSTTLEEISPSDLLRIITVLREIAPEDSKKELESLTGRLSNRLKRISQGALFKLREDFAKKLRGELVEETPLIKDLVRAYELARELLRDEETWKKLSRLGDVGLLRENGRQYLLIPDVATYIQASGRCSRLYPGGITKGLSVIIVDDRRLLNGLSKRLRWVFEGLSITDLRELELGKLIAEIEQERVIVGKILRGEYRPEGQVDLIKSALLIVESPNKAKTIANFFGKPSVRVLGRNLQAYEVTIGDYVLTIVASAGHVYDLVVDLQENYGVRRIDSRFIPVYTDIKKCVNGHQFVDEADKCPRCGTSTVVRKADIVRALKELTREVDLVLIGTDPDSEGEKIGWDLRVLLEPYARDVRRVEFHEVTRKAILEAIRNPRSFDTRLIGAQIVRRVEDRWIGFSLSGIVQKYAWASYCFENLQDKGHDCCRENRNLSAGRVQTPVLGYIIKRYKEKEDKSLYKYRILADKNGEKIQFTIDRVQAVNAGLVSILENTEKRRKKDRNYPRLLVKEKEVIVEVKNPPPPFSTDALLEEASRSLGLATTRTMEIAQDLFEMGLITYHRTDSTRVSEAGLTVARQYLEERFGEKYKEVFQPRTWGEGGAHEAIRPTRPIDADRLAELVREGVIVLTGRLTRQHILVYDLIFRRFIASQMKPAKIGKQILTVTINSVETAVERVVEIVEKGYLEVYQDVRIEARITEGEGEIKEVVEIKPPMARYHDVIRWMKENGIGRPSTYAKIIQTLLDRRYVDVTKKHKALRPTERGMFIHKFLNEKFGEVVSVETTRRLEEDMEMIEKGRISYMKILEKLYDELREKILDNPVTKSLEEEYSEKCGRKQ